MLKDRFYVYCTKCAYYTHPMSFRFAHHNEAAVVLPLLDRRRKLVVAHYVPISEDAWRRIESEDVAFEENILKGIAKDAQESGGLISIPFSLQAGTVELRPPLPCPKCDTPLCIKLGECMDPQVEPTSYEALIEAAKYTGRITRMHDSFGSLLTCYFDFDEEDKDRVSCRISSESEVTLGKSLQGFKQVLEKQQLRYELQHVSGSIANVSAFYEAAG